MFNLSSARAMVPVSNGAATNSAARKGTDRILGLLGDLMAGSRSPDLLALCNSITRNNITFVLKMWRERVARRTLPFFIPTKLLPVGASADVLLQVLGSLIPPPLSHS